jgi:hypothetical protein
MLAMVVSSLRVQGSGSRVQDFASTLYTNPEP